MTTKNQARYRAAFGRIHAPAGAARQALERLKTPEIRPVRPRRRLPLRAALAGAVIAALLAGAAGAEIASGEISNLLAPLYGGAQTELVDGIGVPVDASAAANGYTLTADAVIGDRYHMYVVYTFTRDDGEPIPQGAWFREWESAFLAPGPFSSSGGGSLEILREGLPANQMRIVESISTAAPLLGRNYSVTFQDLVIYKEGEDACEILAEGVWALSFALRYRDCTVKVPLNDAVFTDEDGGVYTLKQLQISPIGLYVKFIAPTPERMEPDYYAGKGVQLSVLLADGTVVESRGGGSGGSWTSGDETYKAYLSQEFKVPVPLEDVDSLVVNGVEIPLDLS